jgi:hypothetical protein
MQLAAAGASMDEDPLALATDGDGDGLHARAALVDHGPVARTIIDVARPEAGRAVVAVLRTGCVSWHVETAVDTSERARLDARPMPHGS